MNTGVLIPAVTVCGLAALPELRHDEYTHVISLWASGAPSNVRQRVQTMFPRAQCAFGFFDDIVQSTHAAAPCVKHIGDLLAFSASFKPEHNVLVHCFAGISRSAAVAFAIGCQHSSSEEAQVLSTLRKAHPNICPNILITTIADQLLKREGRMIAAVEAANREI